MSSSKVFDGVAFTLMVVALFVAMKFGMLAGLFAGLASFALTRGLSGMPGVSRLGGNARVVAAGVLIVIPLVALSFAGVELLQFVAVAAKKYSALMEHLVNVAIDWRARLPGVLSTQIPQEREALREWLSHLLRAQAPMLAGVGKTSAHGLLFTLVGIVVGALAAASAASPSAQPLAVAFRARVSTLYESFRQIVVAQFWIAAINTGFTAVFLFVALPLFKVHVPYSGSLVVLTFVAGMLPIVGNLLCNAVLTLAGLGVGPEVALACLAFLIAVHKLEYVINAKVVGSRISTAAWELIVAMFVFEAVFGVAGLVAAPLYYAYLKLDMKRFGWV